MNDCGRGEMGRFFVDGCSGGGSSRGEGDEVRDVRLKSSARDETSLKVC